MSHEYPVIEPDDFDKGAHDFYDSINHGTDANPDPAKGKRYVEGWQKAEKTYNVMQKPHSIEELLAAMKGEYPKDQED